MTNYPPAQMPWYKSRVIVGALVSILMKLLVLSGLTGEVSEQETQQVIDLALTLIGAAGDLVAIGARVRQRHVPKITANDRGGGAVLSMLLALAFIAPLASCGIMGSMPTAPSAIADQTSLDERSALTITLAYTGAARAAAIAIETGFIDDPATVARIGDLDVKAFTAVRAAEAAYRAGSSTSYAAALAEARKAVSYLLIGVEGAAP